MNSKQPTKPVRLANPPTEASRTIKFPSARELGQSFAEAINQKVMQGDAKPKR